MIVLQHLRINTQTLYGDIMSESLLPHMASYHDQQVIWEMEKQIRSLEELIRINIDIDKLQLESEITEIQKEHDALLEIMAQDNIDQLTNIDNPSFGIATSQEYWDEEKSRRDKKAWEDKWKRNHGGLSYEESGRLAQQKLEKEGHGVIVNNEWMSQEDAESSWGKVEKSFEFGLHISKHHGEDKEITQTCEDCGMVFSGDPFLINDQSMDHVIETGHTTFRVDSIGDKKYHESLELPLEPMGALLLTKTREWWDIQEYDMKLEFLNERFRQAGELAKARWVHLPSHVKDSILRWVDRNSITEKFKSRKQQQWYHATDQTFYDDEPHENRKVEGEGQVTENSWCEYCKKKLDSYTYSDVGDNYQSDATYQANTIADLHVVNEHTIICPKCEGTGKVPKWKRDVTRWNEYCDLCAWNRKVTSEQANNYQEPEWVDPFDYGEESRANEYEHSDEEVAEIGYLDGKNDMPYNATQFMTDKIGDSRKMRIYNSGYHKGKAEQSFESKADDIDWTEGKPDETPFYCPLCAMVIEETATYDGVFDHNKQVHGMSDEDSETLAKGFTYSNSPPTSEESKTSEGIYDPFIDQKSLDQWKTLSSYTGGIGKRHSLYDSYRKGDYSRDGDDAWGYHQRHLDNLKNDPDGNYGNFPYSSRDGVYSYKWQKGGETIDEEEEKIYNSIIMMIEDEDIGLDDLVRTIQLRADHTVDPAFGKVIADVFEESKHDPENTKVKRAYATFIKETIEQAVELQKEGIEFDPNGSEEGCRMRGIGINCGQDGNYADAYELFNDVLFNKHIYYKRSTDDYDGFKDHPLYEMTEIKNIDGENMRANDLFRCVHDINAHTRVRGQFNPDGEQQAYLEHKKLYSADAIRALFTETQGQGNWVNFNSESGEDNIKYQEIGELDKLSFPEQKAFLYPDGIIF